MSDNEATEEKPLKVKKERTEAQKEATRRMLEKRVEIDAIKRGHKNALKTEKELKLKDKVKKIKEVETKMSNYKTDDDEESEEEVVKPVKIKATKAKPKKKIVVEESSSEEEPEIVYVKKSKSKSKKKPKKRFVEKETSSESSESEEEVKPKKRTSSSRYATTELVNQRSQEELKAELVNQRLLTAMRSLGYIE